MTTEHPITPPPELVLDWCKQWSSSGPSKIHEFVATQAARWGADQELEACCQWLLGSAPWTVDPGECPEWVEVFRDCRRGKPSRLKQLALLQLDTLNADLAMHGRGCDLSPIRRALEALPDE